MKKRGVYVMRKKAPVNYGAVRPVDRTPSSVTYTTAWLQSERAKQIMAECGLST